MCARARGGEEIIYLGLNKSNIAIEHGISANCELVGDTANELLQGGEIVISQNFRIKISILTAKDIYKHAVYMVSWER